MRRRTFATAVGLSALAASLIVPTAASASPLARPGAAGAGWSWPTGWSAACGGPGGGSTAGAASCNAIELDSPSAWQGHHVLSTRFLGGAPSAVPATIAGYDPADLQAAYNLTSESSSDGSGRTVAIVDAYNDPNALSDLSTYRAEWGLAPICSSTVKSGCITFTQESQSGKTTRLPSSNVGWSEEISVDLDMVSAICPLCNILLVEASSASFVNLGTAEDTAASAGPVSIGNSYAGGESASETFYDRLYYNHPGIAITVASGDNGYGVNYPAASPDVIAVGGTTLNMNGTTRTSETAWPGAGSGCSAYESRPSWQNIPNIESSCGKRAVADVAAVADPNTGVAVYDTYGLSGWTVFGGTSVSTQIISPVYALAGGLHGTTGASGLYAAAAANPSDFFDITTGSNGNCGTDLCNAGVGWDGPTGLGTPDGDGAF